MIRIIGLFSLFALLYSTSVFAQNRPIRIGLYENPPLMSDGPRGPEGLLVDIMRSSFQQRGQPVELVIGSFSSMLSEVASGKLDLLPGVVHSPQLSDQMYFSEESVLTNWAEIYVHQDSSINTIDELDRRCVAVVRDDVYYRGPTGFKRLSDSFDISIRFKELDSYGRILADVASKRCDAAVVNRFSAHILVKNIPVRQTGIVVSPMQLRVAAPRTVTGIATLAAFDTMLSKQKKVQGSAYYKSMDRWLDVEVNSTLPAWVRGLESALVVAAICAVLALIALWAQMRANRTVRAFKVIFDASQDSQAILRSDAKIMMANRRFVEHFGRARDKSIAEVIPELSSLISNLVKQTVVNGHGQAQIDVEIGGQRRNYDIQVSPVNLVTGPRFLVDMRDTSQRKELEEQLRIQAQIDALTGLNNRRHFFAVADDESKGFDNRWLVMLDIDYFKQINDKYGHDVGDRVLSEIGERMRALDVANFSARIGGEEFIVAIADGGDAVIDRIRLQLQEIPVQTSLGDIRFTLSAGAMPWRQESVQEAYKLVDGLLYDAKNRGRDRLVCRF